MDAGFRIPGAGEHPEAKRPRSNHEVMFIGALVVTYTIFCWGGSLFFNYSRMGPKTPFYLLRPDITVLPQVGSWLGESMILGLRFRFWGLGFRGTLNPKAL